MSFEKKFIPKKSENVSEWYNSVVLQSELADYGPVKGTMIHRPYGYAIWELVQKAMDEKIKARGVENAYFPIFIPQSFLNKEKDHMEGFSPELAVVTHAGGKELDEPLVVRPTSETIMYEAYSRWVHSWRDLPILINQWNNVVRWEKRTYLYLRTSEFLWQEGHTAHATHEEAQEMVAWAMEMYASIYRDLYALDGYIGPKSESEKFAGALDTITYESLMPDGKALQSCTSHDLGQNFSKVFNISFQDKDGENKHVWQTSWGFSTRSLGGLILAHGDDQGLVLPPKLAPIQVVVIPAVMDSSVLEYADRITKELKNAGTRAVLDSREDETFGYKINKWELKGVPVRIELGKREIAADSLTMGRRDTGEKSSVNAKDVEKTISALLNTIQKDMLSKSQKFLAENTTEVETYAKFKSVMETKRGFIKAHWCESKDCEEQIKVETKATTRCKYSGIKSGQKSTCVHCGDESKGVWIFAQSY